MPFAASTRSEEHTSELLSRGHLVCRLLLEKKKKSGERTEVRHLRQAHRDRTGAPRRPLAGIFSELQGFRAGHSARAPPPAVFFFFNDTATTEIYTLSLHDALPI